MNNDTCISVVSSLFSFHSGRFFKLDVIEDMRSILIRKGMLQGLIIDTYRGREMSVFGFTEPGLHGQLLIKRWPVDRTPDLKMQYLPTLKEIISAAVLTVKAVPSNMLTKTLWKDKRESTWETDEDGDVLGVVISAGLLARQCTFCFGSGEFSVYYEHAEIVGHRFKPPHYINNIFHLPSKMQKKLRIT